MKLLSRWPILQRFKSRTANEARHLIPWVPPRFNIVPPRPIHYKEAVERLKSVFEQLKQGLARHSLHDVLASLAFSIFIESEIKALEYLNDENLNCFVPWDENIGLPSLPTMVADVKKYAEDKLSIRPQRYFSDSPFIPGVNVVVEPSGVTGYFLLPLLNSFYGWTRLSEEAFPSCVCSTNNLNGKKVELEIMINHVMGVEDNALLIEELVGVRTDDEHFEKHFKMQKQSARDPNLYIVYICNNKISCVGGTVKMFLVEKESDQTFNSRKLEEIMQLAAVEVDMLGFLQ